MSSLSCRFSSPGGNRGLSSIPAGFVVVPRSPCLRPVGEVPRDGGRGGASLKNRCCCCSKRCPSVPGGLIFLSFAISLMSSIGLPFFLRRNNVGSPIPNLLFLSISLRKSFCDNGLIVPGSAMFTGASPSRCNLAASRCKSFVGNGLIVPGSATFCGDCASLCCLAASACLAFFPNGAMVPGFAMFTADLPSRARLSAS